MSAPRSLAHTRCSLLLKMNCPGDSSISIINNAYWISWETIDTGLSSLQGSLHHSPGGKSSQYPLDRKPPQTSIFKSWKLSSFQPGPFILGLHLNLWNTELHRAWEQKGLCRFMRLRHPQGAKPSSGMIDSCHRLKKQYDAVDITAYHLKRNKQKRKGLKSF